MEHLLHRLYGVDAPGRGHPEWVTSRLFSYTVTSWGNSCTADRRVGGGKREMLTKTTDKQLRLKLMQNACDN